MDESECLAPVLGSGMSFQVLDATSDDGADLIALLPRLGAFPRPEHRSRDSIHQGDEQVIRRWIEGGERDCAIVIARADDAHRTLLGFALIRMQPDAFNEAPSAHLEALAVAERAEGKGVGSALIVSAERLAAKGGARSMTLHVFTTNERAISLYERQGYSAEWIRFIKPLSR